MSNIPVNIVFEDVVSEEILKKILSLTGIFEVKTSFLSGKRSNIQEKIKNYNITADITPFIVLIDLDQDECAPSLINNWFAGDINRRLICRVAVTEAESWLIADTKNFSKYFGIPFNKMRTDPELLPDPKDFIFRMVGSHSNARLKNAIIPKKHAKIGRGYNTEMTRFIADHWDPSTARNYSPSLGKAIDSINGFISIVYDE
jgi:hypothetical protein